MDDARDCLPLIIGDDFLSDLGILSVLLSADVLDAGTLSDFNVFAALLVFTDLEGALSDSALLPLPDDPLVDLLARSLLFLLSLLFAKLFFLDLRDFVLLERLLSPLIFFELAAEGECSGRLSGLEFATGGSEGLFVGSTPGRIPNPVGLLVGKPVSPD